MEKIANILKTTEFESSSTKTQQFKDFVSELKKEFKKEIIGIGGKDIEFHVGHFEVSGFFEYNNQLFYFSFPDVRGSYFSCDVTMMYRTAQHRKDWTGGSNQWVTIGKNMGKKMFNIAH
jgi:hypothetical protein